MMLYFLSTPFFWFPLSKLWIVASIRNTRQFSEEVQMAGWILHAFERAALRNMCLCISRKPLDSKGHYKLKVRALAVQAQLCCGPNYIDWD